MGNGYCPEDKPRSTSNPDFTLRSLSKGLSIKTIFTLYPGSFAILLSSSASAKKESFSRVLNRKKR